MNVASLGIHSCSCTMTWWPILEFEISCQVIKIRKRVSSVTENIGIYLRVIQHLIFNVHVDVLYWSGDPSVLFASKLDKIFKKGEYWEALMLSLGPISRGSHCVTLVARVRRGETNDCAPWKIRFWPHCIGISKAPCSGTNQASKKKITETGKISSCLTEVMKHCNKLCHISDSSYSRDFCHSIFGLVPFFQLKDIWTWYSVSDITSVWWK
jgi:hypothetical protein